jgi:hypothetical protein
MEQILKILLKEINEDITHVSECILAGNLTHDQYLKQTSYREGLIVTRDRVKDIYDKHVKSEE